MLQHICHCDTPHYEDPDDHSEKCVCQECHLYRHDNFDHAEVCDFCLAEEKTELEDAEAAAFEDRRDTLDELAAYDQELDI